MNRWLTLLAVCAALALSACGDEPPPEPSGGGDEGGETATITNRIDIPREVVQNLGITFVEVEERHVEQTLRVPGRFESPPEARREYQTMLPGRVELLVRQYQKVETGTPLFTLDSPEWRKLQEGLASLESRVSELEAERAVIVSERTATEEAVKLYPARFAALDDLAQASKDHLKQLQDTRDHWQGRVEVLEELVEKGAGKAEELASARGQLKSTLAEISDENERQAEIAEQRATLQAEKSERELSLEQYQTRLDARDVEISNARAAFQRALDSAASALGVETTELSDDASWKTLQKVTVQAHAPGTVDHLDVSSGAWVDAKSPVMNTLDLTMLRFRAKALQSDMGLLRDGQTARVVPPTGGTLEMAEPVSGTLRIPTEADAGERVLDVLVIPEKLQSWARPGVTAEAEIVYDETAQPEMAIPMRCVVQDGLNKVVFARDLQDPDKVIRYTPELGIDDGRWIVIYDSVMEGQQVVLDGAYELKLTGTGKPAEGGHFHADGTWHAGPDH